MAGPGRQCAHQTTEYDLHPDPITEVHDRHVGPLTQSSRQAPQRHGVRQLAALNQFPPE